MAQPALMEQSHPMWPNRYGKALARHGAHPSLSVVPPQTPVPPPTSLRRHHYLPGRGLQQRMAAQQPVRSQQPPEPGETRTVPGPSVASHQLVPGSAG